MFVLDLIFLNAIFFNVKLLLIFFFGILLYLFISKRALLTNDFRVYLLCFIFVLISLLQYFFNIEFVNPQFVINFYFIFILTLAFYDPLNRSRLLLLVKALTVVNLLCVILSVHPIFTEVFFVFSSGFFRFKSIFFEPSFLAIFSAFAFVYLHSRPSVSFFSPWKLLNLLFILLSFSGSGVFLVLLPLLIYFLSKFKLSTIFYGFLVGCVVYYVFFIMFPDNLLTQRVNSTLEGNISQSTLLRFYAPVEFVQHVFNHASLLEILFGVGDPRIYIQNFHDDFKYFYIYSGEPTYELNNGYAVLLSMFGFVGLLAFFCFVFSYLRRDNLLYFSFFIMLPFFSGHYVSLFYFFFIYILINKVDN
ncbi:hypothetical protein [Pseudoalteromonas sp. 6BO_GOM-1096m]|uniref:hypothetical protein n=1 Tax=Pseudoalteromonas sp. 6BO_GOM-1096m TaxID=1380359 RepID=UPI00048B4E02|nr:hypothetical protein [Pseudoalteromonas sp. 6BO_GOM-1096m]